MLIPLPIEFFAIILFFVQLGIWGAHVVQCVRSATIWASFRTRNPYFVILLALSLFDSKF